MKRKLLIMAFIIIGCFSLTACGSKSNKETNNTSNDNAETKTVEDNTNKSQEVVEDLELYSDDTKIVFKKGENIKWVFNYSGDNITAYTVYVEYPDVATAEIAKLAIKEGDNGVVKCYIKGKYIVMEMDKSEYENMSVSDLRLAMSYLEEIKKK